MPKFKLKIQGYITVVVEADNDIEARMDVIEHIGQYADEMVEYSVVSEGEEI